MTFGHPYFLLLLLLLPLLLIPLLLLLLLPLLLLLLLLLWIDLSKHHLEETWRSAQGRAGAQLHVWLS